MSFNTVEDLVVLEILPALRKPGYKVPANFAKLVSENLNLDINSLTENYNMLTSQTDRSIKNLVYSLWAICALKLQIIDQSWYEFLFKTLKKLKKIVSFNLKLTLEKLCRMSINKVAQTDITYKSLFAEFAWLLQLEKRFNHDTAPERSFITSLFKPMIVSSLSSYKRLNRSIDKLIQGETIGIYIESTKYILGMQALEWIKNNQGSRKSLDLQNKMLSLKFDQEIAQQIKGTVLTQSEGPLTKIENKYRNDLGKVKVSVWECSKQGFTGRIAAKICKARREIELEGYVKEGEILSMLSGKNENFLKFYRAELTREVLFSETWHVYTIEMEYVERTLKEDKERRENMNTPYSEEEFIYIFTQLITAFNFLKTMNIMHRDIKPHNILISNEGKIKIIDFNIAKDISESTVQGEAAGTKEYMAPEIREALDAKTAASYKSDKSDVFSLGMTLLSLLTPEPLIDLNLSKNCNKLYTLANSIRIEWFKVPLRAMLEVNYNKRIGLSELLRAFTDTTVST